MFAYGYDDEGFYVGQVTCQPSPLEPGVFLLPGNATKIAPPELLEGQRAHFDGSSWFVIDPEPVEPEPEAEPLDESLGS